MTQKIPFLFSFETLSLAFVPTVDPNLHIIVDQPNPETSRVIKNGHKVKKMFQLIQELDIRPICYSGKGYSQTEPILKAINKNLQWTFIVKDQTCHPEVYPNQAFLIQSENRHLISYGEGFPNTEGKEDVRMAIFSALSMDWDQSKKKVIIIQSNPQQVAKLKQNGYEYLWTQVPVQNDLMSMIEDIKKLKQSNSSTSLISKQFQQFVLNSPSLLDRKFASSIHSMHYLQNKKNITVSVGLVASNSPPIFRLPGSMSVCPIVFRYLGDKQIYVAKSQMPAKIGGDLYHQKQQNKVLANCLLQTLALQEQTEQRFKYFGLPMYISNISMRHSLIKAYNKSKATFIVRPYIKDFKTIFNCLNTGSKKCQVLTLLQQGEFNGVKVKGLGGMVMLSLLFGQNITPKGLMSTLALIPFMNKQSKQIDFYQCCKSQFQSCFEKQKQTKITTFEIVCFPQVNLQLQEFHHSFQEQFKQTLEDICSCLPLLESVFQHQVWLSNKKEPLNMFKENLMKYLQKFGIQRPNQGIVKSISKINPKFLNYLVCSLPSESFAYFTDAASGGEEWPGFDNRNYYEQRVKSSQNFIIYGQCVPILSLTKWIKSLNPSVEIIYISLLREKKEVYQKNLKIAKTEKKNVTFILDHCEIQQACGEVGEGKTIADLNWGFRTIFIYRLKMGSCKRLKILHDFQTSDFNNKYSISSSTILQSKQEILKTICEFSDKKTKQSLFDFYHNAILLFIHHKLANYGVKAGITDISVLKDKLRTLVKMITCKNNRLLTILKDKRFNEIQFKQENSPHYSNSSLYTNTSHLSNQNIQQLTQQTSFEQSFMHLRGVPKAQVILYCLPIYIYNQRVWLLHDIFQFLNALYMYEQIADGTWTGHLEGDQLTIFEKWYKHLSSHRKQKVQNGLLCLLNKFSYERQRQTNQIMGMGSNFNDCLQVMKKIGMNEVFMRLGEMFHFDSTIEHIEFVSNRLITISKKNTISSIVKIQQQGKKIWKVLMIKQLQQQSQYKYDFAGSFVDAQSFVLNFVKNHISSSTISQGKGSLTLKELRIQDFVVSSVQQINIHFESEDLKSVTKIWRVSNSLLLLLTKGKIVMGFIEKKQNYFYFVESKQFEKQMIMPLSIESENVTVKVRDEPKQGSAVIAIGVKKAKNENSSFGVKILQFQVLFKHESKQISIQNLKCIELNTEMQVKKIDMNFEKTNNIEWVLNILVFEQVTGALASWVLQQNQQNNLKIQQSKRTYYKIENDPTSMYRKLNTIFVASKYNFVKQMIINDLNPVQVNNQPVL